MSNQTFTITEEQGLVELVAHLKPKYLISSRKYFFVEMMLPTSYSKLRSGVFEKLSKADQISFTTDIWIAKYSNESFIFLTIR